MSTYQQSMQIRGRKLGLLILDARTSRSRPPEKCAKAMGVSLEDFQAIEAGEIHPTLPQIEALAYYLDIPLDHFWGNQVLGSGAGIEPAEPPSQLVQLRQRIIGTRLKMARVALNLSINDLANKTYISSDKIQQYETGLLPTPLPELELLAEALQMRFEDLFDQRGPIGKWRNDKAAIKQFLELPAEVREFIAKPINQPYLELALRLSDLNVEKLRGIAEGILEITF